MTDAELTEIKIQMDRQAFQIKNLNRLRELDREAILRLQGRVLALEEKSNSVQREQKRVEALR